MIPVAVWIGLQCEELRRLAHVVRLGGTSGWDEWVCRVWREISAAAAAVVAVAVPAQCAQSQRQGRRTLEAS